MTEKRTGARAAGQRWGRWLALCAVGLWAGCAETQRPYFFTTPQMAREPVEALGAAFGQNSMLAIVVDLPGGLVQTRWVDTGLEAPPISGHTATVVRRYSATLTRTRFGNDVSLAVEAQRCVVGEFSLAEMEVQGRCAPLSKLPAQLRADLDRLGQRLQQAMSIP